MAAGNGSGKVTVGRKQVGFVILCVFSIVVIRNMMDRTTRLSSTMNGAIKELVTAPLAKTSNGHGAVTEMVNPPAKVSDGHGAVTEMVTPPARVSDGHGAVTEMATPPTKASDSHKQRMILMWTKYFDTKWPELPDQEATLECQEYGVSCRISYHKENYEESDLVVFHGRGSGFGVKSLPNRSKRSPHQRWMYYNREVPPHAGSVSREYNGLFNWSMTFKSDSDFVLAYGVILPGRDDANVFNPNKDYLAGRDKMAVAVISNCHKPRMNYIRELKKYISVDVFGGCGQPCGKCFDYFPKYKFYLSFENCLCKDYVTERFYRNALTHQLVPVAMNKANLNNVHVAPPGSYINALEFRNAKELADYMITVSSYSTLYNSFFKWHSRYNVLFVTGKELFCDACHRLYTDTDTNIYNDFFSWYGTETNCVPYLSPV